MTVRWFKRRGVPALRWRLTQHPRDLKKSQGLKHRDFKKQNKTKTKQLPDLVSNNDLGYIPFFLAAEGLPTQNHASPRAARLFSIAERRRSEVKEIQSEPSSHHVGFLNDKPEDSKKKMTQQQDISGDSVPLFVFLRFLNCHQLSCWMLIYSPRVSIANPHFWWAATCRDPVASHGMMGMMGNCWIAFSMSQGFGFVYSFSWRSLQSFRIKSTPQNKSYQTYAAIKTFRKMQPSHVFQTPATSTSKISGFANMTLPVLLIETMKH